MYTEMVQVMLEPRPFLPIPMNQEDLDYARRTIMTAIDDAGDAIDLCIWLDQREKRAESRAHRRRMIRRQGGKH